MDTDLAIKNDLAFRAAAAVQELPFEATDDDLVAAVLGVALDPDDTERVDYVARQLCDASAEWESATWLWDAAEHPQADSRYSEYIAKYRRQARTAIVALSTKLPTKADDVKGTT